MSSNATRACGQSESLDQIMHHFLSNKPKSCRQEEVEVGEEEEEAEESEKSKGEEISEYSKEEEEKGES